MMLLPCLGTMGALWPGPEAGHLGGLGTVTGMRCSGDWGTQQSRPGLADYPGSHHLEGEARGARRDTWYTSW